MTTTPHPPHPETSQARAPGLDPQAAREVSEAMQLAASAAKRDVFPWLVGMVSVGLLGALALGFLAQAQFAEGLTFLHRDKPVPAPVYAADWVEAPRTLDDLMVSIRASRR